MAYTKRSYDDVESKGGLHFLRDALDCERLGVSVIEVEDGLDGLEHDHAEEDHEEVYVLVEGARTMTVEGESVDLAPGDAVRVAPDATRQLDLDDESLLVVAGAP